MKSLETKFTQGESSWGSGVYGGVNEHSEAVLNAASPDASFCHKVSDALKLGYQHHGGSALTFNGKDVIVAQAVIWSDAHKASSMLNQVRHAHGV